MTISEQSLRLEQEDSNSSYRIMLTGNGRSLSIKQFLFDFAPPAYDHPALWRNPQKTTENEFPIPQAFPIAQHILWIGHDHRRFVAATIGFHRVRIEATVREGTFSTQELVQIFESLVPVDVQQAQVIKNTPFATLAYQSRYEQTASPVPLSYWSHKRTPTESYWAKMATQNALAHLPISPPVLEDFGYTFDSFFLVGREENPSEIDFVYEQKEKDGAYLRFLFTPADSSSPIQYPPQKYTQECQTKRITVAGKDVYLAWLNEYGGFEAVFSYQGGYALLMTQPKTWTNEVWFRDLLEDIIKNEATA
ncbi:MAG: hypothetical protein AAFR81_01805 [Chloroflexota bacterium]